NTLDALASAGLCAALSLSPGAARFDPNMSPHHHAVCDACGLVRDVPCEAQAPAGGDPHTPTEGSPRPPGFQIRAVELIYRGLCAECARAAADRLAPGASEGAPKIRGKRGSFGARG